jgi:hypothetical protein
MENIEAVEWKAFVQKLTASNIIRREEEESLVWAKNPTGRFYPAKLGHGAMFSNNQDQIKQWWRKKAWKIGLQKCKIILWLALSNNGLTWDNFS